MEIRSLETTPLADVVACLVDAFSDYVVQMPADVVFLGEAVGSIEDGLEALLRHVRGRPTAGFRRHGG